MMRVICFASSDMDYYDDLSMYSSMILPYLTPLMASIPHCTPSSKFLPHQASLNYLDASST